MNRKRILKHSKRNCREKRILKRSKRNQRNSREKRRGDQQKRRRQLRNKCRVVINKPRNKSPSSRYELVCGRDGRQAPSRTRLWYRQVRSMCEIIVCP
jgi:hypothetical protein